MGHLSPRSVIVVGLVVSLHALLYFVVAHGLVTFRVPRVSNSITVDVFDSHLARPEPPPPPLSWMFRAPEDIEVPEPEIVLSSDPTLPAGAVMDGPPQLVLPRPDPDHVNAGLSLPAELRKLASTVFVELSILVLPDGTVGDEKVERSSGDTGIDKLAMVHVQEEWRFIPAYLGTKPIEHWIVVFVRFANA